MSTTFAPWLFPLAQMPSVSGDATSQPGTGHIPATTPPSLSQPSATGQTATSQNGSATLPANEIKGGGGLFGSLGGMIPIILMFVILYLFLFRGQKKEEKRRKALLSEMKKGDRVMTIGGLIGRVVSIDNDEVVLKIDESANVKATYKKSSIQQVITPGEEKSK